MKLATRTLAILLIALMAGNLAGQSALLVEEGGVGGTVIANDEAVGGLRDWGLVGTNWSLSVLEIAFTNNGLSPITFNPPPSKSGSNPSNFLIVKQITNSQIPVGMSDTLEIQFYSSTPGVHTASINVPHDSPGESSPFIINLRAEAVVPQAEMQVSLGATVIAHNESPTGTSRDFGDQTVDAGPTAAITLTITNIGTDSLKLSTPDMGGTWWTQFVVTAPGTSRLNPGQSMDFTVAYSPTTAGIHDAAVRISHTDGTNPSPYHIPVRGTGITSPGGGGGDDDDEACSTGTTGAPLIPGVLLTVVGALAWRGRQRRARTV